MDKGYKTGDKFVVEIAENFHGNYNIGNSENNKLYRMKGFNSLVFDENGLDKLEKYHEIPQEKLADMLNEQYERGLNDAWQIAIKLGSYDGDVRVKIFNHSDAYHYGWVMNNYTPKEILSKIEEWEKEQIEILKNKEKEIVVGDVVSFEDGTKGVVMDEDGVDNIAIFTENGCIEAWMNKKNVTKTGEHIEIDNILTQLRT